MTAYVLGEIEITDAAGYGEYTKRVSATIAKYGGRFLVRGGASEAMEGDWPKLRRVLLEFPTMEAARNWWSSPDYEKPKAMRQAASKGRLLLMEGAD